MKEIAHTMARKSLVLSKEATDLLTASLSVLHFFALSHSRFMLTVWSVSAPESQKATHDVFAAPTDI